MTAIQESGAQFAREQEVLRAQKLRSLASKIMNKGTFLNGALLMTEIQGAIYAVSDRSVTLPADDFKQWQDVVQISPDDIIKVGYVHEHEGPLVIRRFTLNDEDAVKTLALKLVDVYTESVFDFLSQDEIKIAGIDSKDIPGQNILGEPLRNRVVKLQRRNPAGSENKSSEQMEVSFEDFSTAMFKLRENQMYGQTLKPTLVRNMELVDIAVQHQLEEERGLQVEHA